MASLHLKYLAVNPVDLKWGTAVNSVGFQEISPGMDYPPRDHPSRYIFSVDRGRVLQEYQLLYITEGKGLFFCDALGREKEFPVKSGMMFLLFPGEWHTYHPDEDTGWTSPIIRFLHTFVTLTSMRFSPSAKSVLMFLLAKFCPWKSCKTQRNHCRVKRKLLA